MERLSKQYRVNVSYPKTRLAYFRLSQRILPSNSLLSHEIQAHLRSALLSSVMVSDLTLHAYSIQWLISTCRYSLFTPNPTSGKPLKREDTLPITIESVAASTQSVIFQTRNFWVQAPLIPLQPSLLSESMLDRYVKAAA